MVKVKLLGLLCLFYCLICFNRFGQWFNLYASACDFLEYAPKICPTRFGERRTSALNATKEGAAVIGFTAAFAAYGGFFIPKSYGTSIDLTGSVNAYTLIGFIVFYVLCVVLNWWYYARKNAEAKC